MKLLLGIAAISGIATFLAILMMIADATIANYGEVSIKINNENLYVERSPDCYIKS